MMLLSFWRRLRIILKNYVVHDCPTFYYVFCIDYVGQSYGHVGHFVV